MSTAFAAAPALLDPPVPPVVDGAAPGRARPPRLTAPDRVRLAVLLIGTGVLYLWRLSASGYANDFYAAAVQAGTKSWKAFFYGSLDSSNSITVDKPPASLWPMEISGRIFGFSSWSMLVPQAIEGVLAVWLLYAIVRRWFGPTAGLLAGALLAVTPVAVLMFRFNNPDALMTLLIVAAAYCVVRALEVASTRWLALAGVVIGFAFLAKGLQPFTVVPALAVAYLVAAPTPLRRRILQVLGAAAGIIAGAGWWVLAVQLTPAADRPYLGGSGDNSPLGLAFGYNGISRITGNSGGAGGGGGANFSGSTGIGRLFNSLNGGQIAWLLPAALIALVALVALTRALPRTDRLRAVTIIFGGWLLVTGAVLSFASGIIHTYYTVELAPAIAALVAIGAVMLWRHRSQTAARVGLAGGVLATGWWSYTLLHRSAGWHPWIAVVVLAAALIGAAALLVPPGRLAQAGVVGVAAGLVAVSGGSVAYAVETAGSVETGSIPSAGPTASGASNFGGGPGGAGGRGGAPGAGGAAGGAGFPGGAGGPGGSSSGSSTTGGFGGPGGSRPGPSSSGSSTSGSAPSGTSGPPSGGAGGGGSQTASAAVTALLKATTTTWAAATIGSQSAAPLELASGKAVMAIGGFSGTDPSPTLAQFEKDVAAGEIHYFIGGGQTGGGQGGPGGGGTGSAISAWVAAHYTATTVGGTTVYDLTKPTSS